MSLRLLRTDGNISTVQLADGSFTYTDEETPNGALTLLMLSLMDKLDISIDDERFVKNGNTVADAMRTFYVDGVGFISDFEVDAPLDGLDTLGYKITMGVTSTVSALTYLQPLRTASLAQTARATACSRSVSAALTETPLERYCWRSSSSHCWPSAWSAATAASRRSSNVKARIKHIITLLLTILLLLSCAACGQMQTVQPEDTGDKDQYMTDPVPEGNRHL